VTPGARRRYTIAESSAAGEQPPRPTLYPESAVQDLLILGAGVHEIEMAEIVERVNAVGPAWNLLGFISPKGRRLGEKLNGYPVLGPAEALADFPRASLLPGNDWPFSSELPRERMATLVDPTCFVSRTAQIGRGCVFFPHGFIGLNARVGDRAFALDGCVVNHDSVVEDRVTFASHVVLAGGVHVEPECYLGQSCTVRQNLRIGRDSLIGMAAVVVDDVPPNSVMVGNPARRLRDRR